METRGLCISWRVIMIKDTVLLNPMKAFEMIGVQKHLIIMNHFLHMVT